MFVWAYGLLRVRTFYKNTHVHVNFHLGLLLVFSAGFLYPIKVKHPSSLWTLFIGLFMTGLPLALGQLVFVAGLGLNKKTGQLIILTGIPVFIGYLVSYFRYGESIKPMEAIGSTLILVGLLGVINCG
jgi:drug/metabolite transporter (DMT)-like permease